MAAKVYVVLGGWEWEGYDEPIGVFSSEEDANAAMESHSVGPRYDYIHVFPCEVQ